MNSRVEMITKYVKLGEQKKLIKSVSEVIWISY